MEYARLGKSDLKVSRISMGCMSLPPDESAIPIIHRAIELGLNFFDTADIYNDGRNEEILGRALKDRRDRILIASKAGNVRRKDGGLDWNPTKQHILKCIEGTLQRLQTDYLDLYQLHGGTINDNIDETISAFEEIRKQGKIRYYGISSIRPNVIREYVKRSDIVSVMMQYSLLDRRPEEECLELLEKNNISVLVRGSVAQGLLIDKPAKAYLEHGAETVVAAAAAVKSLTRADRSAVHVAARYILQHPAITSAVIGMRTIKQLEEACEIIDTAPLNHDEMERLRKAAPALTYREHR